MTGGEPLMWDMGLKPDYMLKSNSGVQQKHLSIILYQGID
jgi:hypothetical protein